MRKPATGAESMEMDGDQHITDMSISEISAWLAEKGFSMEIQEAVT